MKLAELPNHHAILLVHPERVVFGETLFKELRSLSPIHAFFNHTVLNMETARTIITWAQSPYNEEKIALISFHTIGLEAQNALLKILEEPRAGVRFILVTSNKANLLDTVLSRLHYIEHSEDIEVLIHAELFLKTKPTLRMKLPFVISLLAQEDEEGRKDKESVRTFLLSLSTVLLRIKKEARYVLSIIDSSSYVSQPSASVKVLLEYLSLLLPQA